MDSEKKIKILHLRSKFTGDYPLINQIILGLNNGFEHLVCYLTDNGNRADSLLDLGYDIQWLPYKKGDLRFFRYRVVKELDRIVKEKGVDIIHAHRHKPTFYGLMTAKINTSVKLVSTIHGMDRTRNISRKLQNRLLWPRADAFICVSESVRQDVVATNPWLDPDKLRIIYNGIDAKSLTSVERDRKEIRRKWGLPSDSWLWGTAGRLTPVKGHEVLLRTWARGDLKKQGGHLVIAGEGDLRDDLERLAEELGIADNVTLLGRISNIPDFLHALDGFVMPSWKEGCPLALMEAMVTGLPMVASNTGGIPEILSSLVEQKYSYLVSPGDEGELAEAMTQVMNWSPDKYRATVSAIRERSKFFDAEKMIAQTADLYQEITGS